MKPNKDHTKGPITDQKLINLRHIMLAQALRANKKKAEGQMRDGDARCCLCVAQDVAVQICGVDAPRSGNGAYPSQIVADWYGWKTRIPKIEGPEGPHHASDYNDGCLVRELTHAEIADCFIKTYVK